MNYGQPANGSGWKTDQQQRSAAAWLVALDAGSTDPSMEVEFADWIHADPRHEAELELCEAAMYIADRLRLDPDLQWAYRQIEQIDEPSAPRWNVSALKRWLVLPKASVALGALIVLVTVVVAALAVLRQGPTTLAPEARSSFLGDTLAPEEDSLSRTVPLPRSRAAQTPDANRPPVYLDEFPVDSLVLVELPGTRHQTQPSWAQVQAPDGEVHWVKVGDYLGSERAQIVTVTDTSIILDDASEIVLEAVRPRSLSELLERVREGN